VGFRCSDSNIVGVKRPASPLRGEIYDKPGFLARQLHRITAAIFAEDMVQFDITGVQYGVLNVVAAYPGIDQIGVCEALGVDRSTLGSVIDRLEAKGLVTRTSGVINRRSNSLALTTAGKQLLQRARSAEAPSYERLLEVLRPAERALFIDMLTRVIEHHAPYAIRSEELLGRVKAPRRLPRRSHAATADVRPAD
jgi:DNA-binding MarR family transcriptional regulator